MKREAYTHPKMLDLAARLDCTLAQAIGHVSLLINWASDYAIQGDVGKWADGSIARGAGWDDSAEYFVKCLVDSGWLDEHPEHRLIIHDWPDHAENWVRSKLTRSGKDFLECYGKRSKNGSVQTAVRTAVRTAVATAVPTPPCDQTNPNQTEPNPTTTTTTTQPDLPAGDRSGGGGGGGGDLTREWEAARALANENARRLHRRTKLDRKRFLQVAYVAANECEHELLLDSLKTMERKNPDDPFAFWWTVVKKQAEDYGIDLETRLRNLPVPKELLNKPNRPP